MPPVKGLTASTGVDQVWAEAVKRRAAILIMHRKSRKFLRAKLLKRLDLVVAAAGEENTFIS